MASTSQISFRNLGRQSWASAPTPRGGTRGRHAGVVVPYGWLRRAAAIVLGSGTQRIVCASGRKGWVEIGAEITPKVPINAGQSLSHGEAVTAPFAQGSLWDGGCGSPCRFAPRNDSPDSLSFRGGPTGRRGNPSFLRWTWVRAAESSAPTGGCRKPLQPLRQRSERGKSSWSNSVFAR